MALRAFIQSIEFTSDAEAHVVGVVTDDIRKIEIDLRVSSLEELKQRLRQALVRVTTTEPLRALKANDVIDLTPTVIPPTEDELALRAFMQAYTAYQSGIRKIQCGLLEADDVDVAALLQAVHAAYKATYVGVG